MYECYHANIETDSANVKYTDGMTIDGGKAYKEKENKRMVEKKQQKKDLHI